MLRSTDSTSYSCIPLHFSTHGLFGRRLRRWGSTGSWVFAIYNIPTYTTDPRSTKRSWINIRIHYDVILIVECIVVFRVHQRRATEKLDRTSTFDVRWWMSPMTIPSGNTCCVSRIPRRRCSCKPRTPRRWHSGWEPFTSTPLQRSIR